MTNYWCCNCDKRGTLDIHGRCERCGSGQVFEEPIEWERVYIGDEFRVRKHLVVWSLAKWRTSEITAIQPNLYADEISELPEVASTQGDQSGDSSLPERASEAGPDYVPVSGVRKVQQREAEGLYADWKDRLRANWK